MDAEIWRVIGQAVLAIWGSCTVVWSVNSAFFAPPDGMRVDTAWRRVGACLCGLVVYGLFLPVLVAAVVAGLAVGLGQRINRLAPQMKAVLLLVVAAVTQLIIVWARS